MLKIAIIGDKDIIGALEVFGLVTFGVKTQEEARDALKKVSVSDCGIVFILERWVKGMMGLIEELKKKDFPFIVFIPDYRGVLNLDKQRLKLAVRKALGSDVFVKEGR